MVVPRLFHPSFEKVTWRFPAVTTTTVIIEQKDRLVRRHARGFLPMKRAILRASISPPRELGDCLLLDESRCSILVRIFGRQRTEERHKLVAGCWPVCVFGGELAF